MTSTEVEKDAKEQAERYGVVRKANYLAHTIREIEHAILKAAGFHYHILTYVCEVKASECTFFDKGCIIRLPFDTEEINDKEIRIRLAHELGHIAYNLPNIVEFKIPEDTTRHEEVFSWIFAYHLIQIKSSAYENDELHKNFIYKKHELKAIIEGLVHKADKKLAPIIAAAFKKC